MNDRGLVDALRARDANALAELYDKYAEGVYAYCWILTGGPDGAQVALRDTMIAAEARIHALADPARFRVWLYALARGECLRRRPAAGDLGPDTDPGYTGLGAVARDAVNRLAPADRELLELVHRHGFTLPDAARVLGVSLRQARTRYGVAATRLFDAVTAELRGRESQVFGLLPQTVLPRSLRVRVMSCFVDPDLLPYRRLVARRVGPLDGSGFPVATERRLARGVLAGTASVVVTLAVALVFNQAWTAGGGPGGPGGAGGAGGAGGGIAAPGAYSSSGGPADVRVPTEWPRGTSPTAARPFGRLPVVGVGLPTPARPRAATPYGEPFPTAVPQTTNSTAPTAGASSTGLSAEATGAPSPGTAGGDPRGRADSPGLDLPTSGPHRNHSYRGHSGRERSHQDHSDHGRPDRDHPRVRGDVSRPGASDTGGYGDGDAARRPSPGRRPSPEAHHDGVPDRDGPAERTPPPPPPSTWTPRSATTPWHPARRTPQNSRLGPPYSAHRVPPRGPRERTIPAPAPAPTPRPCAPTPGTPPSSC